MKNILKSLFFCFTTLCLLSATKSSAQDKKERNAHYTENAFSHLNISAGFSTLGTSIELATPLASNLKLKAGINFFDKTTHDTTIDLDDPTGTLNKAFGEDVSYRASLNIKTFHTNVFVDYYPFKKGIFHITGGIYIGETKISANGRIVNRQGNDAHLRPGYDWPQVEFDGNIIDINEGRIDAAVNFGNTVKPYLGIGLGRTVSKRRLGVRFEAGMMFAGSLKVTQNGKTVSKSDLRMDNFEDIDKYKNLLKYYPMVKLQLNYRIL